MRLVVCIPSPPSAPPVHSAVKCHTHRLQVFGQCDFDVDALTGDFDEHYMVLGLFGDHQNDDGLLPGTRWVSRSELDEFCQASDLTLLSQWERGRAARQAAREQRAQSPETG